MLTTVDTKMFERDVCEPLVPLLVKEIADKLSRIPRDTNLCRLKIWYYDTCAPCCYFLGDALTEVDRTKYLAELGKNALDEIWLEGSTYNFGIGDTRGTRSFDLLASVYRMMCSDDSDEFKQGHLARRAIVQKVAMQLNSIDLTGSYNVTDDFVAYAQNGTDVGCDTYEDLIESFPPQKIQMLRQRELLGPGASYTAMKRYEPPSRWAEIVEHGENYRHPKDCGTIT